MTKKYNTIDKKSTLKFFKSILTICNKKSIEASFSNFKLTFKHNETIWFATDGEVSFMFIDKNAKNEIEEDILIDAKIFGNFLKKASSKINLYKENSHCIIFDEDKNKVMLKIFTGHFSTKSIVLWSKDNIHDTRPADSFALLGSIENAQIKTAIENGLLDVNENNDGKFFLKIYEGILSFISRDNRRITVSEVNGNFNYSLHIGLRLVVISQILEFASNYDKIQIFEKGIEYIVCANNEYICFKTLPKDSIDCKTMCNHDKYKLFKCKTENLKNAISFASILQSKFNSTVILSFKNNELYVEINDPTSGKYNNTIEGNGNAEGSICIKLDYIANALHICKTEYIEILYNTANDKLLIRSLSTIHLIMPIILNY